MTDGKAVSGFFKGLGWFWGVEAACLLGFGVLWPLAVAQMVGTGYIYIYIKGDLFSHLL